MYSPHPTSLECSRSARVRIERPTSAEDNKLNFVGGGGEKIKKKKKFFWGTKQKILNPPPLLPSLSLYATIEISFILPPPPHNTPKTPLYPHYSHKTHNSIPQ
mgnify:CR=1 FL=1